MAAGLAALRASGALVGSEDLFRHALESNRAVDPQHQTVFLFEMRIAETWVQQGRAAPAEEHLRRLLEGWAPRLSERRSAEANGILGESVSAQGRCEEAEPLLVESFKRLLEAGNERSQKDALERLRSHFEQCDKPQEFGAFAAMLEAAKI